MITIAATQQLRVVTYLHHAASDNMIGVRKTLTLSLAYSVPVIRVPFFAIAI
jgi:hypothetical protein